MTSAATAVVEQPATEGTGLPNKFVYPEFAGFAGEELLHEIVSAILPLSLLRTWEIFERKHAYDNDCFQSLGTVAKKARRTQRTVNRNIATFLARGLLVLRSEYKFFRRPDGSVYKKAVVVKDFSGLYALAHEYYEWQYAEDYLAPEHEYVEHIQHDPRLQAKLCRFEDYRRLLEHHRDPFAQVQEDRRFTEYRADAPLHGDEEQAEDVKANPSSQNGTKLLPKEPSNETSEVSKKRINEKAYSDNLQGDSFDSDGNRETREAGATSNVCSQNRASVAGDYTKARGEQNLQNESATNPVPPSHKNVPPGAGKTRESAENHPDVQQARRAMAEALVGPGRSARHQAEELPPPPKHPLARSFVHEVAGLFGDLNEKGSKTGIERSIESFELEPAYVLLCLVRAYVVARDTKDETIRHRRPETGAANRMPLFCTMFRKFAQALGPGSTWQYTWEHMLEDIAADDRLNLWVSEHQAELAGDVSDQAETTEASISARPQAVTKTPVGAEAPAPEVLDEGWERRDEACACAEYLAGELAANEYVGLVIKVRLPKGGARYQIFVFPAEGLGYCLVCEEDVAAVIEMARDQTLFATPEASDDQAEASD